MSLLNTRALYSLALSHSRISFFLFCFPRCRRFSWILYDRHPHRRTLTRLLPFLLPDNAQFHPSSGRNEWSERGLLDARESRAARVASFTFQTAVRPDSGRARGLFRRIEGGHVTRYACNVGVVTLIYGNFMNIGSLVIPSARANTLLQSARNFPPKRYRYRCRSDETL